MRVARDRLIFHALCVLEDAADEALCVGRLPPRASVRLALGILYAFSRDVDAADVQRWHRELWHELTCRSEVDRETAAGFGRCQSFTSLINGIACAAGMPRDHDYLDARKRLRGKIGGYRNEG